MQNLLLLGGTLEARRIAADLAGDDGFAATLSLAGVTSSPPDPGIPMRTGGFGGVDGLAEYLKSHAIDVLVDATHPYASRMSANAVEACNHTGIRRLTLWRPAWQASGSDDWREFPDWPTLIDALPDGARVFLAAGQDGMIAFSAPEKSSAPEKAGSRRIELVARALSRPDGTPENLRFIQSLPGKTWQDEAGLFTRERISHIVAKNSGGTASTAKLAAARELGLPVLMLARPDAPEPPLYDDEESLLSALRGG